MGVPMRSHAQSVQPRSQGPSGIGRPRRRRSLTGAGLIGVAIAGAVLWVLSKPKK
jgi:hypothetical protein